ncbi:MAG: hypothetical protein AB1403_11285 [Candidatus Riflebacteria bacterium]
MIKKLILILLFFLIIHPAFAEAVRPIYGYSPVGTGSGGGADIGEITDAVEATAVYGEDISAGDAVIGRVQATYDVGVGAQSAVTLQTILTSTSYYGEIAWHSSGRVCLVGHSGAASTLQFYRLYFSAEGSYSSYNTYSVGSGLPAADNSRLEISPQGDKLLVAHGTTVYVLDITYTPGGVFTAAINATATTDINLAGGAYNCAFNPQGNLIAISHVNSPWATVYRRLADGSFVKIPNPDVLAGSQIYRCAWTKDGKQLICTKTGATIVYNLDYDAWTMTKAADIPNTNSQVYVTFNNDYTLMHLGSTLATPYQQVFQINYDGNGLASFTEIAVPSDALGYAYEAAFIGGNQRLTVPAQLTPFTRLYKISYNAGVASLSINTDFNYSFNAASHFVSISPSLKHVLSIHNTVGYRYFFGTFDNSYTLTASDTPVFKPTKLSDYWSAEWFGYAKETGTAGQTKPVVKFPAGY